jgi:hypothetical protein
MNRKLRVFLLFLGLSLLFQVAFSIGLFYQNTLNNQRTIASIETRIALDLSRLKIANKKFRTAADPSSIQQYLLDMNETLQQIDSSVLVVSLQDISIKDKNAGQATEQRVLKSPEQDVSIEVQWIALSISLY